MDGAVNSADRQLLFRHILNTVSTLHPFISGGDLVSRARRFEQACFSLTSNRTEYLQRINEGLRKLELFSVRAFVGGVQATLDSSPMQTENPVQLDGATSLSGAPSFFQESTGLRETTPSQIPAQPQSAQLSKSNNVTSSLVQPLHQSIGRKRNSTETELETPATNRPFHATQRVPTTDRAPSRRHSVWIPTKRGLPSSITQATDKGRNSEHFKGQIEPVHGQLYATPSQVQVKPSQTEPSLPTPTMKTKAPNNRRIIPVAMAQVRPFHGRGMPSTSNERIYHRKGHRDLASSNGQAQSSQRKVTSPASNTQTYQLQGQMKASGRAVNIHGPQNPLVSLLPEEMVQQHQNQSIVPSSGAPVQQSQRSVIGPTSIQQLQFSQRQSTSASLAENLSQLQEILQSGSLKVEQSQEQLNMNHPVRGSANPTNQTQIPNRANESGTFTSSRNPVLRTSPQVTTGTTSETNNVLLAEGIPVPISEVYLACYSLGVHLNAEQITQLSMEQVREILFRAKNRKAQGLCMPFPATESTFRPSSSQHEAQMKPETHVHPNQVQTRLDNLNSSHLRRPVSRQEANQNPVSIVAPQRTLLLSNSDPNHPYSVEGTNPQRQLQNNSSVTDGIKLQVIPPSTPTTSQREHPHSSGEGISNFRTPPGSQKTLFSQTGAAESSTITNGTQAALRYLSNLMVNSPVPFSREEMKAQYDKRPGVDLSQVQNIFPDNVKTYNQSRSPSGTQQTVEFARRTSTSIHSNSVGTQSTEGRQQNPAHQISLQRNSANPPAANMISDNGLHFPTSIPARDSFSTHGFAKRAQGNVSIPVGNSMPASTYSKPTQGHLHIHKGVSMPGLSYSHPSPGSLPELTKSYAQKDLDRLRISTDASTPRTNELQQGQGNFPIRAIASTPAKSSDQPAHGTIPIHSLLSVPSASSAKPDHGKLPTHSRASTSKPTAAQPDHVDLSIRASGAISKVSSAQQAHGSLPIPASVSRLWATNAQPVQGDVITPSDASKHMSTSAPQVQVTSPFPRAVITGQDPEGICAWVIAFKKKYLMYLDLLEERMQGLKDEPTLESSFKFMRWTVFVLKSEPVWIVKVPMSFLVEVERFLSQYIFLNYEIHRTILNNLARQRNMDLKGNKATRPSPLQQGHTKSYMIPESSPCENSRSALNSEISPQAVSSRSSRCETGTIPLGFKENRKNLACLKEKGPNPFRTATESRSQRTSSAPITGMKDLQPLNFSAVNPREAPPSHDQVASHARETKEEKANADDEEVVLVEGQRLLLRDAKRSPPSSFAAKLAINLETFCGHEMTNLSKMLRVGHLAGSSCLRYESAKDAGMSFEVRARVARNNEPKRPDNQETRGTISEAKLPNIGSSSPIEDPSRAAVEVQCSEMCQIYKNIAIRVGTEFGHSVARVVLGYESLMFPELLIRVECNSERKAEIFYGFERPVDGWTELLKRVRAGFYRRLGAENSIRNLLSAYVEAAGAIVSDNA